MMREGRRKTRREKRGGKRGEEGEVPLDKRNHCSPWGRDGGGRQEKRGKREEIERNV